jgi:hypothetical protein
MASDRDTMAADLKRSGDTHGAMGYNLRYWGPVADDMLAAGYRLPAQVITTAAELDALPGRSIVVGHRGKFGTGYQLTSWDAFTNAANWASPYDIEDRSTSRQVIEREGSVTVLYVPTEEAGDRG